MKVLETFPKFKIVSIEDKKVFDSFSKYTIYSDFNLLSMLSWDVNGTNEFSILDNNLVVKVKDYLSDGYNYSIIGETEIDKNVHRVLNEFNELKFVPETVVEKLHDRSVFKITEDRDNYDYIISIEKVTNLAGNEMKPLRRHIHRFEEKYSGYEIKQLDYTDRKVQENVLELTNTWVKQKNFNSEKLEEEIKITKNFLKYAPYFNCDLLGLFIQNKFIAYTFNEKINADTVMGHFGKSLSEYEAAAYFMEYQTAKFYLLQGFKEINQEQDAGIDGLRTYKLTFKPARFLKKFIITNLH